LAKESATTRCIRFASTNSVDSGGDASSHDAGSRSNDDRASQSPTIGRVERNFQKFVTKQTTDDAKKEQKKEGCRSIAIRRIFFILDKQYSCADRSMQNPFPRGIVDRIALLFFDPCKKNK
jgi:hypothetical protein